MNRPEDPESLDALGDAKQPSLVAELLAFLTQNKKWWMLPILVVLAIFGALSFLASSAVAPYLYNLW